MRHLALTSLSTIALVLAGCSYSSSNYSSKKAHAFTTHHADGRTKPSIHVLPVHDISGAVLNWSLASEMDETILKNLSREGEVYVYPKEATEQGLTQLQSSDLTSRKNNLTDIFKPAEFVAELEMVDHYETQANDDFKLPKHLEGESVKVIVAKMRVRLFDLRWKEPKLILQEIVEVDQFIDRNKTSAHYEVTRVGSKEYAKTPLGNAHRRLAEEVSSRIQEYIAIAKSRRNAE